MSSCVANGQLGATAIGPLVHSHKKSPNLSPAPPSLGMREEIRAQKRKYFDVSTAIDCKDKLELSKEGIWRRAGANCGQWAGFEAPAKRSDLRPLATFF